MSATPAWTDTCHRSGLSSDRQLAGDHVGELLIVVGDGGTQHIPAGQDADNPVAVDDRQTADPFIDHHLRGIGDVGTGGQRLHRAGHHLLHGQRLCGDLIRPPRPGMEPRVRRDPVPDQVGLGDDPHQPVITVENR